MQRYPPLEWFVGALLLITSSAQHGAAALQPPHQGSVIEVTDDNFDALSASPLPWIIVFGAPWCDYTF